MPQSDLGAHVSAEAAQKSVDPEETERAHCHAMAVVFIKQQLDHVSSPDVKAELTTQLLIAQRAAAVKRERGRIESEASLASVYIHCNEHNGYQVPVPCGAQVPLRNLLRILGSTSPSAERAAGLNTAILRAYHAARLLRLAQAPFDVRGKPTPGQCAELDDAWAEDREAREALHLAEREARP